MIAIKCVGFLVVCGWLANCGWPWLCEAWRRPATDNGPAPVNRRPDPPTLYVAPPATWPTRPTYTSTPGLVADMDRRFGELQAMAKTPRGRMVLTRGQIDRAKADPTGPDMRAATASFFQALARENAEDQFVQDMENEQPRAVR